MFVIYLGFFAGPVRDPNRTRYLLGTVQVQEIAKAVERYRADCGEYPSMSDGLNALVLDQGVEGWNGPYPKRAPLDPWRQPYICLRSTDSATPEILSYGADQKPGGEFFNADITSRHPQHSIPESPFELRANRLLLGSWIGAWICLIGSLLVLARISRRHSV